VAASSLIIIVIIVVVGGGGGIGRFEVFTAVSMKNAVFWDVMLCVALVRTDVSEERIPYISSQRASIASYC
jgi:hypothetical protein